MRLIVGNVEEGGGGADAVAFVDTGAADVEDDEAAGAVLASRAKRRASRQEVGLIILTH